MAYQQSLAWYDPEDDIEDNTVKAVIQSAIENDGGEADAIEQAALTLDKFASKYDGYRGAEGYIDGLEDIFIYVAAILDHKSSTQDALVRLVSTLRSLPQRSGTTHCPEWDNLLNSKNSIVLHEAWNGTCPKKHGSNPDLTMSTGSQGIGSGLRRGSSDVIALARWRNFNAFEARMTHKHLCDSRFHALCCFRDALENLDHDSLHKGPPEFMVNVAMDWLSIAGDELFKNELEYGFFGRNDSDHPDAWKGFAGFCTERWELWRSKFERISMDHVRFGPLTRRRAVASAAIIQNHLAS